MAQAMEVLVFKTVVAFLFALMIVFILKPFLALFALAVCDACDPITYAFALVVLPLAAVFASIYQVIGIFTKDVR